MPDTVRKVMVIGSGPIVIGQAAEFDYAGTQACRSLREEGVEVVLVNSNPATIMTDRESADRVYIEPMDLPHLEAIIAAERPDGLLPTLGGQTGLNLATKLWEAGIPQKYGMRLLGTSFESICKAEDRELFKATMQELGMPVPPSYVAGSFEEALTVAGLRGGQYWDSVEQHEPAKLTFPLIIRPGFTLGGTGGGIANNQQEYLQILTEAFFHSPNSQVLVEQCLVGWKELEYEVMRDGDDNCIMICNMENIDPMGIHTGDSIVVAPSLTLSDADYQMLRTASLKIIRALKIEGGCNVQFALSPHDRRFYVIEVNPRVSRSSALASKATGYPIARVAAKIALGKRLHEIVNKVTGQTMASFEPALDYVVLKFPKWPFDKFREADRRLGTQMKATGEVMSIDRSFDGAFLKALAGLEVKLKSFRTNRWRELSDRELLVFLAEPTDGRMFALFEALYRGYSPDYLHNITGISRYFIDRFHYIVNLERRLRESTGELSMELVEELRRCGVSNELAAAILDVPREIVERFGDALEHRQSYKAVDTCAAEFDAVSPYFYSTYAEDNDPLSSSPADTQLARRSGTGAIAREGFGLSESSIRSAVDDFHSYHRNLPHWRLNGSVYWITWRLHQRHKELPFEARDLVVDALLFKNDEEYKLLAYVVMDDHVHVLAEPLEQHEPQKIVQAWKSVSAHRINKALGWSGPIWQDEYKDRIIRNEEEFYEKLKYTLDNPKKRWPTLDEYQWVWCSYFDPETNEFTVAGSESHTGDGARATTHGASAHSDFATTQGKVLVLGSGPIRIGQGIEFDYASVHALLALEEMGYGAVIVNNNPETVSTDFDVSDTLYFEPLTFDSVRSIVRREQPLGVVCQFGGQTAINLAAPLDGAGIAILGTTRDAIDETEDRERFDALMERLGIPRPAGETVLNYDDAIDVAHRLRFPVLVRPSYVLGGRAMQIIYTTDDLRHYIRDNVPVFAGQPLLIDSYVSGKEVEVDVISDGENVIIPGIMEHIERAGIHSGDSMAVYPPQTLSRAVCDCIVDYGTRIARAIKAKGLINIQFVVDRSDNVYVIEVNPRASRTVPFISKITGVPMIRLAMRAIMGHSLADCGFPLGLQPLGTHVAVKAPVFSFQKLRDLDVQLGPEMKSTGEVMGIATDFPVALRKAMIAAGMPVPTREECRGRNLLATIADIDKAEALEQVRKFAALGFNVYSTAGTTRFLQEAGIPAQAVRKLSEGRPHIVDQILNGAFDLIINTVSENQKAEAEGMLIRRAAVEHNVPIITSLDTAGALLTAIMQSTGQVGITELGEITAARVQEAT